MTLVWTIVVLSSISAKIVSASTIDFEKTCKQRERKRAAMSPDTVNQKAPAGTWTVDPVHSSVTFAITHNNVATFRSGFETYDVTLVGGEEPKLGGSVHG